MIPYETDQLHKQRQQEAYAQHEQERWEVRYDAQKNKRTNLGFTLMEMVVVVMGIGILAAIAVPTWLTFVEVQRLNTAQGVQGTYSKLVSPFWLIWKKGLERELRRVLSLRVVCRRIVV